MIELEKEALKYAQSTCNQCENISLDNLLDYAKTDFIAGAEWNKSISKAPEMLEMLEEIWEAFNNRWDDQLDLNKIKALIKEATTL